MNNCSHKENDINKKTIYIDFDGVLNTYDGWDGKDNLYKPKDDINEFLKILSIKFKIVIFTTRNTLKVCKWLIKYRIDNYIENITNVKNPAYLYIDDRAINFNGNYQSLLSEILEFKPHWQK